MLGTMTDTTSAPARRDGDETRTVAPVLDIVVPVYNEASGLATSVQRLHAYLSDSFPFSWRLTIVDNASTDETWFAATSLARDLPHVCAVHLDRKGRGLALKHAWSASDATVVAYMDVDLSTDLDALLPLVAPLVSGHSDVAIGSRLAAGASVARRPKREFISRIYNLLLRTVFATRVRDAQCGFKAIRADVARRVLPAVEDDGWFFDTELLLLAERNGLRIHEVPVDWVDDPDSRVNITRTALGDLAGSARMAAKFATGHGRVELGDLARRRVDDDFGRRLVELRQHRCCMYRGVARHLPRVAAAVRFDRSQRGRRHRDVRREHVAARAIDRARAAPDVARRHRGVPRLARVDQLGVARGACSRRRLGAGTRRARSDLDRGRARSTRLARPPGAAREHRMIARVAKCLTVSVGTTALSALILAVLAVGFGVPAGIANVVAVVCGIGPSYVGNRRWVWQRDGRGDTTRELIPFWALSLAGLVLSTVVVAIVGSWSHGWAPAARGNRAAARERRSVRRVVVSRNS